jgi:hypothetical protein
MCCSILIFIYCIRGLAYNTCYATILALQSWIVDLIADNSCVFGNLMVLFALLCSWPIGRKGPTESGRLDNHWRPIETHWFHLKAEKRIKSWRENSSSAWTTRRTSHRNFSLSRKCGKRCARESELIGEAIIIWIAGVAAGSSSSTQPCAI